MGDTTIEWAEKVWNCLRGCSLKSPGCTNCYAMRQAHRFSGEGQPYEGLTKIGSRGPIWTGNVIGVPEKLAEPLSWRKPALVFVNSMSDLFHDDVPDAFIDQVFGVMAKAYWHTFQVLTKRPERMAAYLSQTRGKGNVITRILDAAQGYDWPGWAMDEVNRGAGWNSWPYSNVWPGVSVEDQARLDERADSILRVAEAGWLTWLSAEPLLSRIDAADVLAPGFESGGPEGWVPGRGVSWVVVGGESGPGARPCDLSWIRAIVGQCKAAGVPAFVKQLGSNSRGEWSPGGYHPYHVGHDLESWKMKDRKGGDLAEFPPDLRIREFPRREAVSVD